MKTYKRCFEFIYCYDSEKQITIRLDSSGCFETFTVFSFKLSDWDTYINYQPATGKEFKKAFNLTMKNLKQFVNGTPTYD